MKINVLGKNVTITQAMSKQINKKLERISNLFDSSEEIDAKVVVSTCKGSQTVEISVNTGSLNLRVKVTTEDMYSALDLAIDKLEGQMRKVKTQMLRKRQQNQLAKHMLLENIEESDEEIPVIVKKKNFKLYPMDTDEAITRMEALNHNFFIFLNSENGLTSVLYAREDGKYGLIELEEEEEY